VVVSIELMNSEDKEEDYFLSFAKKHYFNASCASSSEFLEDLKRIKYVKRLIFRFHKARTLKSIKERLIVNHLIVLRNVFGDQAAAELLFMKHEIKFHSYLKSFLVFLKFNIKDVSGINYEKLSTDPRIDRKLINLTEQK
jgi:hypothetical protein